MKWAEHPEHLDTLRTMVADGASASEVGAALGCSRNAVIGAAHRNNVVLAIIGHRKRHVPPRPRNRSRRPPKLSAVTQRSPTKTEPVASAAPPQPCSLVELTNVSCRWPHGEPHLPGFFFCGSPEADMTVGVPYCRFHRTMAYAPRRA